MSILASNLKHFYQRPAAWGYYLAIGVLVPMALCGHQYGALIVVSLIFGILAGSFQKEVLSKPFSYCLPGHRKMPRRVVMAVGAVVSLALALLWVLPHGANVSSGVMTFAAAWALGMTFYLLSVVSVFVATGSGGFLNWFSVVVLCAALFAGDKAVSYLLNYGAGYVLMSGGFAIAGAWKWLGREDLGRTYCGKRCFVSLDMWNPEKLKHDEEKREIEKLSRKKVSVFDVLETLVIRKMGSSDFKSRRRHIWSNMYMVVGKSVVASGMGRFWSMAVFFVIFYGYMLEGRASYICFLAPAVWLINIDLLGCRSSLLGGGRRERYWGAVFSGLLITAFSTAVLTSAAFASVAAAPLFPAVSLGGEEYSFGGIRPEGLYIALVLAPPALAVGTITGSNTAARTLGVFLLIVVGGLVIWLCEMAGIDWTTRPVCIAASLAMFLALLSAYCKRCELGVQSDYSLRKH